MLADDWGYDLWPRQRDGASHPLDDGHSLSRLLPQIDRWLVAEGLQLTRHYTASTCSPSRQSLLSGRSPHRVNHNNKACEGLPLRMPTLATRLKAAGYQAHFVGKWHVGFLSPAATPCRRGFDSSLGFFLRSSDHFTHCARGPLGASKCATAPDGTDDQIIYDLFEGSRGEDRPVRHGRHAAIANRTFSSTLWTDAAVRIIREHDGAAAPLFLMLAYSAPHAPLEAPPELQLRTARARWEFAYHRCAWKPPDVTCSAGERTAYEAMALSVDDGVGRVVEALRTARMWSRSLLVFTSDNGGARIRGGSNLPLRGGKYAAFEGGVRVVAALGGGALPTELRGQASASFMHLSDWYATFCHVAGVDVASPVAGGGDGGDDDDAQSVDSISMWAEWLALRTRLAQGTHRRDAAAAAGAARRIVLSPDAILDARPAEGVAYKLLTGDVCECFSGSGACPCLACGDDGCLFDVLADPSETTDLASHQPSERRQLRRLLEEARSRAWVDDEHFAARIGCTTAHGCDSECEARWLRHAWQNGAAIQPFASLDVLS